MKSDEFRVFIVKGSKGKERSGEIQCENDDVGYVCMKTESFSNVKSCIHSDNFPHKSTMAPVTVDATMTWTSGLPLVSGSASLILKIFATTENLFRTTFSHDVKKLTDSSATDRLTNENWVFMWGVLTAGRLNVYLRGLGIL